MVKIPPVPAISKKNLRKSFESSANFPNPSTWSTRNYYDINISEQCIYESVRRRNKNYRARTNRDGATVQRKNGRERQRAYTNENKIYGSKEVDSAFVWSKSVAPRRS